jgi:hypothetical protein
VTARERRPAVRARSAQDALDFLDTFKPGSRDAVRQTMPPEVWEEIQGLARTAWIPVEKDHWVVDGFLEVLGEVEASRCWASFLTDHVRSPLLRSIFDGAVRILGPSPGTFVRIVPHAWGAAYRDCATPIVEARSDHHARIVLEDIAPEVMAHPAYLVCFESIFRGLFSVAKTHGELEFTVDEDQRRAVADLSW